MNFYNYLYNIFLLETLPIIGGWEPTPKPALLGIRFWVGPGGTMLIEKYRSQRGSPFILDSIKFWRTGATYYIYYLKDAEEMKLFWHVQKK